MARVEIILRSDGRRWIGRGGGFAVEGVDLTELEDRIEREIVGSGLFAPGTSVEVSVLCRRDVLPAWIRPYHSHYFNRTISFVVGEGEAL